MQLSGRRLVVLLSTAAAWAAIMPAVAPARSQTTVTIKGGTITIAGTIKEPIARPPLSIMIFDSRGMSAGLSKRCDARPNADGEMPWVIHTTRRLTPPGRYSIEFIWFAHHKIVHRSQTFRIPPG